MKYGGSSVEFSWGGKLYNVEEPEKDQILKWGIYVPYIYSDNPEEKVVIDEFVLWSARLKSPIVIPRWFLTDLASIPSIFRSIVTKSGELEIASLPHDFGYALNGYKRNLPVPPVVTRDQWDLVFKDFAKQQKMGVFTRTLAYLAVKLGGGLAFRSENEMFIPKQHRYFYMEQWAKLQLDIEDGKFIIL